MTEHDIQRLIDGAAERAIEKYGEHHPKTCPLSSEDIVFLHNFRKRIDKIATGVGMSVILAVFGGIYFLIKMGLEAWRQTP